MKPVLGTQRFFEMQREHFLCQEQKSLEIPLDDEDLELEERILESEKEDAIDRYEKRMERQ